MDLAPLKVFSWFSQPKLIRSSHEITPPKIDKCFFCNHSKCKSELCDKKHAFKATVLGTCQMCYALEHEFEFESSEYELYNVMCEAHVQPILEHIIKSGRSIDV